MFRSSNPRQATVGGAEGDVEWDVVIVGPFPPPLGGVSAHVLRLSKYLAHHGVRVAVVSHFGRVGHEPLVIAGLRRNPVRYLLVLPRLRTSIIHYQHARWSTLLATATIVRARAQVDAIVTIHGHSLDRYLQSKVPFVAPLTRWALDSFDETIAVSSRIAAELDRFGLAKPVTVIPAYLPSRDEERREGLAPATQTFADQAERLLVVSAYRLLTGANGSDVYGIEYAINLLGRIAATRPGIALACFIAQRPYTRPERRNLDRLRTRIAELGIETKVRLCFAEPLLPVFAGAVLYLRPSQTDGDAVSVREALDTGVTVLASDVVARPEGVVVCRLEDPDCWYAEIERWMTDAPARQSASPTSRSGSAHAERLLTIYHNCWRRRARAAPQVDRSSDRAPP